jgi:hypothetical protein
MTLKAQLDAVRKEMSNWPDWRKREIDAEVLKTPLKDTRSDDAPGREGRQ